MPTKDKQLTKNKNKILTARLDMDVWLRLRKEAEDAGLNMSDLVRAKLEVPYARAV